MAATGESTPTSQRSMRTASISPAPTSTRRTTTIVGAALRSGDLGKNSLKRKTPTADSCPRVWLKLDIFLIITIMEFGP